MQFRPERSTLLCILCVYSIFIFLLPNQIYAQSPSFRTLDLDVFRFTKKLRTTGTLKPKRELILKSELSEEIKKISVDEGDTAPEGRVLLTFDTALLSVRKRQALHRKRRAKVRRNISRKNYRRKKSLYEKDLISESEYDQARLDFQQARENFLIARANYREAVIRFSRTKLKSPFPGLVEEHLVEPGEQVRRGQGLIRYLQIRPLKLHFEVTPNERSLIQVGETVPFTLKPSVSSSDSDDKLPLSGTIRTLGHDVNRSGLYSVTAIVHNSGRRLLPGRTASISMPLRTIPKAVEIPLTYVDRQSEQPKIILYDPKSDSLHKRPVEIIDYRSDSIIVPLKWDPSWELVPGGIYTDLPKNSE